MSEMTSIWEALEIEPTKDPKIIKRSYSRMMEKYHPEEYPEKFQQIYTAYEMALQYAKSQEGQYIKVEAEIYDDKKRQRSDEYNTPICRTIVESTEKNEWIRSDEISQLANQYAIENENQKIHDLLYGQFVQDIAWERLNQIVRENKIQSHALWQLYFQDKIVLEAICYPQFLTRFVKRAEWLKFKRKTVQMMDEVFMNEIPGEYDGHKKLHTFVKRDSYKKIRNRHIKMIGFTLVLLFLMIFCGPEIYKGAERIREENRIKEIRAVESIEAYLESEYQIECTVEKSYLDKMNNNIFNMTATDPNTDYFNVTVENDEVKNYEFHLCWSKQSDSYSDIIEDIDSQLVSAYAEMFHIEMTGGMTSRNSVSIGNTTLEKYEPQFMEFVNAIKESDYVQSGHIINLKIEPYLDVTGTKFERKRLVL